ncbi:hypothetical protein R5R35_003392 [Gryllus longicercus]|uniref:Uncharacterized protein n=1 Tax=Gryllus longicercus TaxID=2509291 RepID=A0AAN9ZBD2_9ORTH
MKLKERLVLGLSVSAVLFTLLLVMDLQLDWGMSGHHLVSSHGRVRVGGRDVDGPGSAYNSFRKRFLQRSNNASRESSGGGTGTAAANAASHQQDAGAAANSEPHDDFGDLQDYVLQNAGGEAGGGADARGDAGPGAPLRDVLAKSAPAPAAPRRNPTLADLSRVPMR